MLKFVIDIMNYYEKLNMTGGKSYRKSISNPKETPWLDWISKGIKKYEGRLRAGIWNDLKVGDNIILFDRNQKEVKTRVIELKYYDDFGKAFEDLGYELVPIKNITVNEVKKLYSKYFSDNSIKEYGVVAVGIKVIN